MDSIELIEWAEVTLDDILNGNYDKSSVKWEKYGKIIKLTMEEIFETDK